MNRTIIKVVIALAALVWAYYYVKHKIGERQAFIVNSVIGEVLKEDAVFIGSLLPVICQEDNKISYVVMAMLANDNPSEADSIRMNAEMTRMIRELPARLEKATLVNNWQKSFVAAIKPCLKDLKKIPHGANYKAQQYADIFAQVEACMKENIKNNSALKVEIVSHFSNRILKNITNNYSSFMDKLAVSLLASGTIWIEGKDALTIYENLKKEFFISPEFTAVYNNGCLKQLDEMAQSVVMVYFLQNRDLFN